MLLQIASCSVHYSGALLLEARDGEFLDKHLCSSSTAASTQTQQPNQLGDIDLAAGQEPADAAQSNDHEGSGGETFDHYDDGGAGDGDFGGDDHMQDNAAHSMQGVCLLAASLST